jgi:hypothetical protein
MRKANKIKERLGGDGYSKPKHMHWNTFYRLQDKAFRYENLSLFSVGQRFGIKF